MNVDLCSLLHLLSCESVIESTCGLFDSKRRGRGIAGMEHACARVRICICHRLSGAAARFLGEGLRHGFFLDTIRGTGAPVHASRH